MNEKEYFRMIQWLGLAAIFYTIAISITPPPEGGHLAQIQTGFWKAGHITSGAYLGYWIDRHLFGRYDNGDDKYIPRSMARAIVVGCAILGMAFGL